MSLTSCVVSSAALAPRPWSAPLRESSRIASRRRDRLVVRAGAPVKTVEEAKEMLDREGYKMLDIRPFKAYDREHLTKPPQCTVSTPWVPEDGAAKLVERVENQGFRPSSGRLLVADFDGDTVRAAADALLEAGYDGVVAVEGGYNGWRKTFTTCGRRRPPQGKWVSSGEGGESLKSGLTLDPNVAAAYEENWGKAPPKHGETGVSLAKQAVEASRAGGKPGMEPEAPAGKRPDGFTTATIPDVALRPLAMDAEIAAKRREAEEKGLTAAYKSTISGGEGGAWGSDWDTYYTEDENRTPYYVNRVTGTTQWEEPKRWWANGMWIDAK